MTEQVLTAAAEMAEARAKLEEAEAGIRAAMGRALAAVREAVTQIIADSGFTVWEVLDIAPPGPAPEKAKAKRDRKASDGGKGWALASDPSLVYVRGKMPAWLKAAMHAVGLNPEAPEARAAFRSSHMVQVSE